MTKTKHTLPTKNKYSVKIFDEKKYCYPTRGIRVECYTPEEAIEIAKVKKKIPADKKVIAVWHYC